MSRSNERPDIDRAAEQAQESRQRAERDLVHARESAKRSRSLARLLQRLREDNGFERIMNDAFGGSRG